MWRGCLLLVAGYAAMLYLEYQQIQALPFAWGLAVVLALGATLLLASLQGLVAALRLREQPQTDISQWVEGAQVRISGVLQPVGEALRAPISDQPVAYCVYSGKLTEPRDHNGHLQTPHWNGMLAAPCVLRTSAVKLQVIGMPSLAELPHIDYQGQQYAPRVAHHLATTDWQRAPEAITLALGRLQQMLVEGLSAMPAHLINTAALAQLQMQIGQSSEAELLARLEMRNWHYRECVVPPGAEVTLVGTYRASPPGIDINYSLRAPERGLFMGAAGERATKQLGSSVIFIVVWGALTAAAHFVVYADAGFRYLDAVRNLGLIH